MNGDLLRIVDAIHRDKKIPKEIVFEGIESALQSAARKYFGGSETVEVTLDRETGNIEARDGDERLDPNELGRISAQTAKQVMIQKIREAERDALYEEYKDQIGNLINGMVQRVESGAIIVNMGRTDGILPRSQLISGETVHPGERSRAVIMDVRKSGQRVKIVLSRTHPDFVRRLFELEVPEIQDRVVEIKAMAREAAYRTKIAVSSFDSKVDAVGACVGVRGTRIKNIVDELGGEKIDIVRWNDSMQVLIPNALKPAEIDEVYLSALLGRAVVIVRDDQLSLAIGRRGQNVRLASRLSGWDIEIMTAEEFDQTLERAQRWFGEIPGVGPATIENLIQAGFLSYDDIAMLGPEDLAQVEGVGVKSAETMIAFATEAAERVEEEMAQEATRRAAERAATEARKAAEIDAGKMTLEQLFPDTPVDATNETPATEAAEEAPDAEAAETAAVETDETAEDVDEEAAATEVQAPASETEAVDEEFEVEGEAATEKEPEKGSDEEPVEQPAEEPAAVVEEAVDEPSEAATEKEPEEESEEEPVEQPAEEPAVAVEEAVDEPSEAAEDEPGGSDRDGAA